MDAIGKSDPYLTIEALPNPYDSFPGNKDPIKELDNKTKQFLPRVFISEIHKDDSSPEFEPFPIFVSDIGGLDRNLIFKVNDFDHKTAKSELIGKVDTNLLELTFPDAMFKLKNPDHKKTALGKFIIEEVVPFYDDSEFKPFPTTMVYNIKLKATKIKRMEMGLTASARKSSPYLKILAISYYTSEFKEILESEVVKKARDAEWETLTFNVEKAGGLDSPIRVQIWDKHSKKDELIGECVMTLRTFKLHFDKNQPIPLYNRTHSKEQATHKTGILHVVSFDPS